MRIEGLGPSSIINIKGFKDIAAKLKLGEKLSVQIVGMEGNELTLRFSNGTNVTATTLFPLEVNLGDFLDLTVKSKNESQVVLETVKNTYEEAKSKDVIDTLMSMKLPPNERNIELGRALANQHLALNKENFKSAVNVLSAFEGMDIDKAAFVVANGLDKLENGIEMLNKYENNQVELGRMINKLINSLGIDENKFLVDKVITQYDDKTISNLIENEDENIHQLINNFTGSEEETDELIKSFVRQVVNQSNDQINGGSNNLRGNLNEILKYTSTADTLEFILPSESNKELFEFLESHPDIEKKVVSFLNNKPELKKMILDYRHQEPVVFNTLHPEEKQSTFEKVQNFFKDVKSSISENGIKSDIDVNKLYTNLLLKLDMIEQNAAKYSTTADKILANVENMKQNIDFTSSINNLFTYYQIPLNMNQRDTTLDLYVVKNTKEHKKIDPDNATMFISLNTVNLGLVESLIHVHNNKVDFSFRLDDDKTIGFFARKVSELEKLLKDKGYTLNKIRFDLNPKRTNILNFEHVIRENKNIVKDVFDVKV